MTLLTISYLYFIFSINDSYEALLNAPQSRQTSKCS